MAIIAKKRADREADQPRNRSPMTGWAVFFFFFKMTSEEDPRFGPFFFFGLHRSQNSDKQITSHSSAYLYQKILLEIFSDFNHEWFFGCNQIWLDRFQNRENDKVHFQNKVFRKSNLGGPVPITSQTSPTRRKSLSNLPTHGPVKQTCHFIGQGIGGKDRDSFDLSFAPPILSFDLDTSPSQEPLGPCRDSANQTWPTRRLQRYVRGHSASSLLKECVWDNPISRELTFAYFEFRNIYIFLLLLHCLVDWKCLNICVSLHEFGSRPRTPAK